MEASLEEYLSRIGLRLAPSTHRRLSWQLLVFVRHLESLGLTAWYQVTGDHLLAWLADMRSRLQPSTVQAYGHAARDFLEHLVQRESLLVSPWPEGLRLRRPEGLPRHVPGPGKVLAFLHRVEKRSRYPIRDRAILELAYGAGLRRSELCALNVQDIREDWLKVRGKGDRERFAPLGSAARKWLECYMRTERPKKLPEGDATEDALFLSHYGCRLNPQALSYIVLRHRPDGSRATLHGLRHACATHMLRNGASIRIIQKLLGHSNLSTTQIYTHLDVGSLKKLLQSYHPRK